MHCIYVLHVNVTSVLKVHEKNIFITRYMTVAFYQNLIYIFMRDTFIEANMFSLLKKFYPTQRTTKKLNKNSIFIISPCHIVFSN